jgi:hypothetical protein
LFNFLPLIIDKLVKIFFSVASKIYEVFKLIGFELILFFAFFIVLNNYIGRVEQTIKADGEGYYDYLPAYFIHNDLERLNWEVKPDSVQFRRVNSKGCYIKYGETKVNKYTVGTAFLQSPFFMINLWMEGVHNVPEDGYQESYHLSVFAASIFYLFCTVFLLRLILISYGIEKWIIKFLQLLLLFSTGVLHYSNFDASYSHIYSLFVISLFIWTSRLFFTKQKMRYFVIAFGLIGLVFILRQVNILIIFFLPFLAGTWKVFIQGVLLVVMEYKKLILGFLVMSFFLFIQLYTWYIQTGDWVVYSYQGEGFNWSNPEVLNVLFSFQKGLFIYTPILFVSLLGLIRLLCQKRFYLAVSWFLFFALLTYVLSSWWCWFYGASFGMRPFIDFYMVFFILFAMLLSKSKWYFQVPIVVIGLLTIPVNIIQTYQYKQYILHWGHMDELKYWRVFLKTDKRFEGLNWKKEYNFDWCFEEEKISFGDLSLEGNKEVKLIEINASEVNNFNKVFLIKVQFTSDFSEEIDANVIFGINDTVQQNVEYWHSISFISFTEGYLNEMQRGEFNYEFDPIKMSEGLVISLEASTKTNAILMENITFTFYSKL